MNPTSWNSRRNVIDLALAAVFGLGVGWIDLQITEVAVIVLALLLSGLLLGFRRPAGAWRWAALLALGLPIMAAVGLALGVRSAEPIQLDPRIVLAAFVFALVGCYGGAMARRLVRRPATTG